jgi:hypothetical protein
VHTGSKWCFYIAISEVATHKRQGEQRQFAHHVCQMKNDEFSLLFLQLGMCDEHNEAVINCKVTPLDLHVRGLISAAVPYWDVEMHEHDCHLMMWLSACAAISMWKSVFAVPTVE